MANNTPKPDKISTIQKTAISMFISSAAVYELLKSSEIQKSLGAGYVPFLMGLTIFGLTCAAISGPQILELLEALKEFMKKKRSE